MKLIPTVARQSMDNSIGGGTSAGLYYDVSLDSPDEQFQVLSDMLQANDAVNPAPNTGTPPWGEPISYDEYLPESVQSEEYIVAADMEPMAYTDLLSVISDPFPADIPEWTWENDQQYFGLGVPPGVPNFGQPIESGHTQITLANPSAELGWDAWSGRPVLARVARHENDFKGYNAGVSRGHVLPIKELQNRDAASYATVRQWQYRNMLMSELQKRGLHTVVIADVPMETYNEQVAVVDPTMLMPEAPIGPEGVLP